jgi:hypothetical protein
VAEAAALTPEVVTSLQTLNAAEIRLDAPIGDSDDSQLVERFMWDEAHEPEEAVEERLLAEHIDRALETLQPRDAKVVSGSTSASRAAASTRSRRSATCSASRASASASCATARCAGSARASWARRWRASPHS